MDRYSTMSRYNTYPNSREDTPLLPFDSIGGGATGLPSSSTLPAYRIGGISLSGRWRAGDIDDIYLF